MAKCDIKDGFWRLDCEEGKEWNFAYVMPQEEGQPIRLVVPTSLQMGWIESPPFFCAATETGRDVAEDYVEAPVGSLPEHKFEKYTAGSTAYNELPPTATGTLQYLVEVCGPFSLKWKLRLQLFSLIPKSKCLMTLPLPR